MAEICPIIGIGASAGGLAALEEFFDAAPADMGAAYVVIQHLDPKHSSMIAEILSRHTSMPVQQIEDGMHVERDHVYVIPPNAYATLNGDVFKLGEAVLRHGVRMPIDTFFTSLAAEGNRQSVGVILSGTGSDGSMGLRELKAVDGIVLAQSPNTAQFDGMPRAAIATGQVDVICKVSDMIPAIRDFLEHDYVQSSSDTQNGSDFIGGERKLNSIISVLQAQLGVDFRGYKPGTLGRRIARRMSLKNFTKVNDYLTFLREDPNEAKKLYQDLLISVTSFFRDAEAFDTLYKEGIVKLVQDKAQNESVRVWVPGCASGEEAYSIAMLLMEELERTNKDCTVQIFATDIDEEALALGRTGIYSPSMVAGLSTERLERFFVQHGNDYQITKQLREKVTFASQNVISDPPFSRLDLISCRNLLIYLNPPLQDRIIGYFHFALRSGGYLFLGRSESVSQLDGWFEPVDKTARLYRRLANATTQVANFPVNGALVRVPLQGVAPVTRTKQAGRLRELMQQHLLRNYAPAAVLTNAQHQVLYFMGPTSRYLEQPSGVPTQDLLSLAHAELRKSLRLGIKKVLDTSKPVTIDNVSIKRGATRRDARISIQQLVAADQPDKLIIVTFEDIVPVAKAATAGSSAEEPEQTTISELEDKLRDAQEDLQINLEELESTNEELQASNEEMMSVNEELQSANEELETSKEELQAMNEELSTVNNQLKDKVEQYEELNDDLANFVSSTGIATLLLSGQHRIGRFTPSAKRLFNLIETDMGRPIGDIRQKFDDDKFLDDVDIVFQTFEPVEREVTADDGVHYLMRIAPYRADKQRSSGVVVTFVDISHRLENERQLRESEARFRDLFENTPDPLLLITEGGAINLANSEAQKFFGYAGPELSQLHVEDLVPERYRKQHSFYREAFVKDGQARPKNSGLELFALTKSGEEIPVEIALSPVETAGETLICAAFRDIREHEKAMQAVKAAQAETEAALNAKSRFLATASHDLRQPLQSLAMLNEAIKLKIDDPELVQLVERESVSLEHMRSLLNSLLDISKLDAGATKIEIKDVDLSNIITDICTDYQAEADRKGVKLVIDVQDRIVRSDPDLLQQVFSNLIGNAIRYTDKGSVTVRSHINDTLMTVEVKDTGKGIPADQYSHIFEEFYQIGRDPQQGDAGLGLGLAIARRIAQQLGTEIKLESEIGKGSTFSLELPLSNMLLADKEPEKPKGFVEPKKDSVVLLVDDDVAVLKSTGFLLNVCFGERIYSAQSPKEAEKVLSELASDEPDIIVTDHHLNASTNGIDLIEHVRKDRGRDIPAILVSGDTSLDGAELKSLGIELIQKPSRGNELVETMTRLLST